jgi:prevent-host-death family protein
MVMKAASKKNPAKAVPVARKQVRTIAAGEFKAKCLQLMDEVAATGETIIITKRGKPVVSIAPPPQEEQPFRSLYGLTKGSMKIHGDIVSPLPNEWEADRD